MLIKYIRKFNSSKTFNYASDYVNYANGYFIIGKVLGYKYIDIRRIPIYSLFYILKNNTFQISNLEQLKQNIPTKNCDFIYASNLDDKNNKILNIVLG